VIFAEGTAPTVRITGGKTNRQWEKVGEDPEIGERG